MNLALISLAVTLGWCSLLAIPWILTGNPNPLDSSAGYVILAPLLIPVWILGESGGGRCPRFTHSRLNWISKNSGCSRGKFFVIGLFHGAIFAIPSAALITYAVACTLDASGLTSLIVLTVGGLIHLGLFVLSFFVTIQNIENWGRRIYHVERQRRRTNA